MSYDLHFCFSGKMGCFVPALHSSEQNFHQHNAGIELSIYALFCVTVFLDDVVVHCTSGRYGGWQFTHIPKREFILQRISHLL